jgi:glutamyl-tRNA reductase
MNRLLLLGLNHTTAPIEVRERLALSSDKVRAAVGRFRARFPGCEVAILSTCNRVELYAARPTHGHPRVEELTAFLADVTGTTPGAFAPFLYEKTDRAVVEHLFGVSASLDSMVLGETQILGQVREAYELSSALGATGNQFHPLFQRAIAVGRQVMAHTPLAEGRTSVASVAVEYARQIFDSFGDKTVLSVGAGKMAQLVLRGFAALRPGRLVVCNRDVEKGTRLASTFGGEHATFDRLTDFLVSADVVVTSTGAEHAILTKASFESIAKKRRYRPLFVIDIALPRDVEPAAGDVENVFLYNLDDLQKVVTATHETRGGAVDAARGIISRHVDDYLASTRAREMGPVIDRLYKRYHDLANEELTRTLAKLPNVSEAERAHLQELTRRIVNKLLHDPIRTLRRSGEIHAPAGQYLHALEQLFKLETASGEADETVEDDDDLSGPSPGGRGAESRADE